MRQRDERTADYMRNIIKRLIAGVWKFETLKANPNVHKVVAFDMKDCIADPQGQPRELWPRNEAKTAHAG